PTPAPANTGELDPALVARGQIVFQTAGGIGCQYCHGPLAFGDVGPNIRGKSKEAILQAFAMVQMMDVVAFTPLPDVEAVAAFLQSFALQDSAGAAAPAVQPAPTLLPTTVPQSAAPTATPGADDGTGGM
ncbi:MAG: hypothetical protein K8I60_11310, partial [Anaerolineae bacterium]|nr:hypothetical protein [Anaerolineae bacterium]